MSRDDVLYEASCYGDCVLCDSADMMQQRGKGRRTLEGRIKGKSLGMMGMRSVSVDEWVTRCDSDVFLR